MTPTIILTAVKEKLSDPKNWGAYSLVAGQRHCLLGAILVAAGYNPSTMNGNDAYELFETEQVLIDTIDIIYESMRVMVPYEFNKHRVKGSPKHENVSYINDALRVPEIRHDTMMNLLEHAINKSQKA